MCDPWVRKIPWSRKWHLTQLFLPGKSQGQRSLMGYSSWGSKESDTTEHACVYIQLLASDKIQIGIDYNIDIIFEKKLYHKQLN